MSLFWQKEKLEMASFYDVNFLSNNHATTLRSCKQMVLQTKLMKINRGSGVSKVNIIPPYVAGMDSKGCFHHMFKLWINLLVGLRIYWEEFGYEVSKWNRVLDWEMFMLFDCCSLAGSGG